MISPWPIRSNVLIKDGMVYFTAGVFPYEGIYVCCLDAGDGAVVWRNDTMGDRAHELDYNGISPQGYLLASDDLLFVPSGRALPAAFDLKTGEFRYYMRPAGHMGGTWALLNGGRMIAGVDFAGTPHKEVYDTATGKVVEDPYAWYPAVDMVVTDTASYIVTRDAVIAVGADALEDARRALRELRAASGKLKKAWDDIPAEEQEKITEALKAQSREDRRSGAPTGINEKYDALLHEHALLKNEVEDMKRNALSGERLLWKYDRGDLCSIVGTANILFVGGDGIVVGIDPKTGRELWREKVRGRAAGLAVCGGSLYVSTEAGGIYCFGEGGKGDMKIAGPRTERLTITGRSAVDEIVRLTGVDRGYCLVLGCGRGDLARELAVKTQLNIIVIDDSGKRVRNLREKLDRAGLLGARVTVAKWGLSQLPDYFANLIVSEEVLSPGRNGYRVEELCRVLRPCGGKLCIGRPGDRAGFDVEKLAEELKKAGLSYVATAGGEGSWVVAERGKLEGAGAWTHVFADPQNSSCSDDRLVRGSLRVLWFGAPGPKGIIDRHASSMSPVSMDGRLFVEGEETIRAYDSYNGAFLWKRKIPGAVRVQTKIDSGNLALSEEGLYVAAHDKCYRLDPATGEVVREYKVPVLRERPRRRWGYIARVGNILYGSAALPLKAEYGAVWNALVRNGAWVAKEEVPEEYLGYYERYTSRYPRPNIDALRAFKREAVMWRPMHDWPTGGEFYLKDAKTAKTMVSDMVFALDADTGETLWVHEGKEIANITITIGDGRIYFTDAAVTDPEKRRALRYKRRLARKGVYLEGEDWNEHFLGRRGYEVGYDDYDVRRVLALDAETGEKIWENVVDFTGCAGDAMGAAYHKNVLMFFGNYGNHDAWRHSGGELKFRRVTALSGDTGEVVWSRPLNYRTRPLIVGDKLILEPYACDYRTGELVMRTHPVTGERVPWEFLRPGHCCSVTSASPYMLFTRSFSRLMYDLENDRGVTLFGGIRASCFINMIPANGLLLFPEGSSGCTCSFPVKCSVALEPVSAPPDEWAVYVTHGDLTPVRHFAVNLGAPADMKDTDGTVWFGYPNPKTDYLGNHYPGYGVKFDLRDEVLGNMGYFAHGFRGVKLEGTDRPWLFTSGCTGLVRCSIPVADSTGAGSGVFTVRLGFMAPAGDRPGQRVFTVSLEGKPVLVDFDIRKEAGASEKPVVKEFGGVLVDDRLDIELTPKSENPDEKHAPIINFIEIIREGGTKLSLNTTRP